MSTPLSRLGFHYFPDDSHYTEQDLEHWLPVLIKLSARWLVLPASSQRAVPEAFIRGLLDSDIRPVIWIKAKIGEIGPRELAPMLSSYARWGVEEVVVFDRPNQRASWGSSEWALPDLVERFVDRMLPILQLQRSVGLNPVFPPLEPGGDYWDTAFLESAILSIQRRGQGALLSRLILAVYGWTHGLPLDWGYGGPANWPEAEPYAQVEGVQDQVGFRAFDWYASITRSLLGLELPMIVVAGGPGRPEAGLDRPAQRIAEILRAVHAGELPDSVLAFSFYLLASSPESSSYSSAWFAGPGEPKPLVAAAKRVIDGAEKEIALKSDKPLGHYVLLPAGTPSEDSWMAARELAADSVVGFSVEEASQAKRVTLVGDEGLIPPSVERRLSREGCQVTRLETPRLGGWPIQSRSRQ